VTLRQTARQVVSVSQVAATLALVAMAATAQQAPPARKNTYTNKGLFAGGPPRVSPQVNPDRTISFQISAPKAQQVDLLFGEWDVKPQPMTKNERGLWTLTIGPVEPEIYSYMFRVDGVQALDFANPRVKNGTVIYGNSVDVPGNPPRYDEAQGAPHGVVEVRQYMSTPLKRLRSMYVYLPPQYEAERARRFPVLYLRHGGGDEEGSWLRDGRADIILDNLLAQKKAVPMIIVMTNGMTDGSWAGGSTEEAIDLLGKEQITDVMPLVDKSYRTLPGRENHAITGLSMGGGQAFIIGLRNLDKFAWVGNFSSGLMAGIEYDLDKSVQGALKDASVNQKLRLLWMGCGTKDPRYDGHLDLVDVFKQRGINHVFVSTPGGHEWKVWRHQLDGFLRLVFQPKANAGK
jgi:enterochelin esterase-like enzyme